MKSNILSLLILSLFLFIPFELFAQDVIILKNGDEIQSVVSEIGLDAIKYKRFDNPEGPVYTLEKSKIFMIKYANGTKDVFGSQEAPVVQVPEPKINLSNEAKLPQPLTYKRGIRLNDQVLSDQDIRSLFASYPEPLKYYEAGQTFSLFGEISSWSVLAAGIFTALKMRKYDDLETKNLIAKNGLIWMGGFGVGWITFSVIGSAKTEKAVQSYNTAIKQATSCTFQLFYYDNQLGLAMRF